VRRAGFLATAIAVGAGAGALSTALEEPVIEYVDIRMPRLPQAFDGFTIVQLSDFHYDPFFDDPIIRSAVAKTNELKRIWWCLPETMSLNISFTAKGNQPTALNRVGNCCKEYGRD